MTIMKKAGLGLALAATALASAAPADAQRYGRYYGGYGHRGGDVAGAAVLGGIVGLGVGAVIASSNRNRYYDRGYYRGGYGYYSQPRGVYYEDYRYEGPRCFIERRFDPYNGQPYRIRVCN